MRAKLPQSMQVILIEHPGDRPVAGQLATPRPGPGEVLIRVAASPVNPSDLGFINGSYGFKKPFPAVPGFEGSGVVIGVGSGLLPRLWLGRRVAFSAATGGAWAEYLVTQAKSCLPLARNTSLEQGAMLFINPLTALAFLSIARQGRHKAMVSNAAASALGRMILRLGQIHHLPIIHVVRRPAQVELLRSLGGQYILNSRDPQFPDQLRTLSRRLQATLILDPVAGEQTQRLLDAAPEGSTVLVYGSLSGKKREMPARITGDKQVAGFFLPDWAADHPVQAVANMFRVRRLAQDVFETTIQARFPLADIQQALGRYEQNPTAGKVLLVPNPAKVSPDGSRGDRRILTQNPHPAGQQSVEGLDGG